MIFHKHPLYAEADEDCHLPRKRGIVGTHRGYGAGKDGRVPVLMLETFTVQGGATRRTPQQKAPGHHVGGRPNHVAHALEAKHRVEDIKRNHGDCEGGVSGPGGDKRGNRASLTDTLLQNLPVNGLPIGVQCLCVHGRISLTIGGVNTRHLEQCVHAKGTRLIRHNRYNKLAYLRVFQEFGQQPHHGGGGRQAP